MQPYKLFIPPCTYEPAHKLHPPPLDMPLRIHIEGPLVSIQKLLPAEVWNHDVCDHPFPQPGGPELARLTFDELYGQAVRPPLPGDLVVRDEYLGWCGDPPNPITHFDYYGITFDHLVPVNDPNPEVLQINIIELEAKEGDYAEGLNYAKTYLRLAVEPDDYIGRILAVPRCCTTRKGTTDRRRINDGVAERVKKVQAQRGHSDTQP